MGTLVWRTQWKPKKNWLFKDIKNILFVSGAAFFLCSTFGFVMNKLGIAHFWMYSTEVSNDFLSSCIFAPFTEEIIFRWLPITTLLIAMSNNLELFKKLKWYFAALISMLFGVAHYGYFSIFIQGIFGFGMCYLYYKNRFGYFSAVIAHAVWNFSLGFILPTVGYTPDPIRSLFGY